MGSKPARESSPVRQFADRLLEAGLATRDTIHGCTFEEVSQLEADFGAKLPSCYREFLSCAGKGAGDFLVGTDWTFPRLLGLQEGAANLLEECKITTPLPEAAFVFAMHQGYSMLYFDCTNGDDPPVHLFTDSEPAPRKVFDKFSTWLLQCLEDDIEAYESLK